MSVYDKGFEVFPNPEGRLLELIIIGDVARGNWFAPGEEDIRKACVDFDLSFEEVMTVIDDLDRGVHTLLIHVPLFKKHRLIHPRPSEGAAHDTLDARCTCVGGPHGGFTCPSCRGTR